ncbi:MAG: enoyl-CoA hydratase/isomerase family protein [Candidatus Binatia bacterium]
MKNTAMEDKVLKGVLYSEKKAGRLSLGFVTLDSSRSLNALDLRMLHSIEKKLLNWRRRDDIACVVLSANSKKAFCAGGDIKSLVAGLHQDKLSQFARDYFTTEYFVDYLIHVYPKPILCWADGITMGGGIGIMNGASYRVVTERSLLAMPETAIGFFTDVGATYFLNQLPSGLGLFLGLTAARFNGFDAVKMKLAEGLLSSDKKNTVFEGLSHLPWTEDPQKNIETLHRYLAGESEVDLSHESDLLKRVGEIQKLVNKSTIDEVDAAFRKWKGKDEWIESALQGYFAGSPTSVKTVFEQLKRGKNLSLKDAFLREWNMAMNYCERSDLREGVRAVLVDKDHRPRWNPPALSEVQAKEIERYFSEPSSLPNLLGQKIASAGIG